jgi:hypothetical protein
MPPESRVVHDQIKVRAFSLSRGLKGVVDDDWLLFFRRSTREHIVDLQCAEGFSLRISKWVLYGIFIWGRDYANHCAL